MPGDGYPGAVWIPAHPDRYTVHKSRTIEKIVLHITSGGFAEAEITAKNAFGIAKYLKNGKWKVQAAHYIVGRDGTIVQCVRHKDSANHAGSANKWSIGIEHNVRAGKDTTLEDIQYLKSAELVVWLCKLFGIPTNRKYIIGHAEADPKTTHKSCPAPTLNWDTYMAAIAHVQAIAQGYTPMRLWNDVCRVDSRDRP
jgi:N-acetyl-anhydromuramyl-L-alanine amidase AmpD